MKQVFFAVLFSYCLQLFVYYQQFPGIEDSPSRLPQNKTVIKFYNKLIHNPSGICRVTESNLPVFTVIVVMSSHWNSERRAMIRKTWGSVSNQQVNGIRLVFIIGKPSLLTQQESIDSESEQHHDIIQVDCLDTYRNMTLKSIAAVKWVTQFCPGASYMFKTDDDVYVNTDYLVQFLANYYPKNVILGHLITDATPNRNPASKWYVSEEQYPYKTYPTFTSGGGYIISMDIIPKLASFSQSTPFLPYEDVYITGLCASQLTRIQYVDNPAVRIKYKPIPFACSYYGHGISFHPVPPELMEEIWKSVSLCWSF